MDSHKLFRETEREREKEFIQSWKFVMNNGFWHLSNESNDYINFSFPSYLCCVISFLLQNEAIDFADL